MAAAPFRLALIADAHFHDPEGDFGGVGTMLAGKRLALRPWAEMRAAGRAVNESAEALCAALDRAAAAGARQVILAGDYSDEGQAGNIARLARLLAGAEARLGLRIFVLPGNHDLYGVAGKHVAMPIVTAPGRTRMVTSDPDLPGAVLTAAMRRPGQAEALAPLATFGLMRRAGDLHWESPFGGSDRFADRQFLARSADGGTAHRQIDASYLVEPEAGLWLLMIDANAFEPRPGIGDPRRKRAFADPTDAGWDAMLRVKPFVLGWIADVAQRARAGGKLLLPVSHYPVLPSFAGETDEEQRLFGNTAFLRRRPAPEVASRLAAAGLRLHFGGHLHVSGVTRADTPHGPLTDVGLPSPVAFAPAFTLVEGSVAGLRLRAVPLGDLTLSAELQAFLVAEGAPRPAAPLGEALAERFRERVVTRRLPRAVPATLPPETLARLLRLGTADLPEIFGEGVPAMPLSCLVAEVLMLREAGVLALPHLPPAHLAFYRHLAARQIEAPLDDDLVAWLGVLLRVLALALRRIDEADKGGGVTLQP